MGMAGKVIKDVVVIGGIALVTAYAAINKDMIYEKLGLEVSVTRANAENTATQADSKTETALPMTAVKGVAVSIPKSKKDGQYWATARVNNGMVNFLIDTGASTIALTPEDARRAGIRMNDLVYDVQLSTAAGPNVAAAVNLKSISIGPITLRNVRAIVVPQGLSNSLLGMTFLGELQKVEATPNAMILRL